MSLLPEQRLDHGTFEPCPHPATEFLGSNQDAVFMRCRSCGATLVQQDGRVWVIPARRSRAR
jgi:hypothetical protein